MTTKLAKSVIAWPKSIVRVTGGSSRQILSFRKDLSGSFLGLHFAYRKSNNKRVSSRLKNSEAWQPRQSTASGEIPLW
jgi:hypothetical protein